MNPIIVGVVSGVICLIIGTLVGVAYRKKIAEGKIGSAELEAARLVERATIDSEAKKKEILLEAKEESIKTKNENEKENKERRNEISRTERRLVQKEETLDKKSEALERKDEQLQKKFEAADKQREELAQRINEQLEILEQLSGLTRDQAKEHLLASVQDDIKVEMAHMIKDMETKAKLDADKKAKDILAGAMQRCAVDHVPETTVSVVALPNDEMKGRIIGREGRNIRTLESLTGIDLIIDDTPEAIVISSFDPLRREIAKISIETLIKDGRIHPTRIEELYDKTVREMKTKILEYGNDALFQLGLNKMDNELIEFIGKLHFRTSYGQNALNHSLEVAHLAGVLASELGENVNLAKRAGLLHDIGKAVDHEIEGSHVEIGIDIAKKFKEPEIVVNSIASHHGDYEASSVISVLIQIADTLSASRPGARSDSLEHYIKRLEQLENIANDIKGIDKSYAVQAGREIRVLVKPEEIDDLEARKVAREIKEKIEKEMQYPGTIKVTVVRETRAQEEAK